MSAVLLRPEVTSLFDGDDVGLELFERIAKVINSLGMCEVRVTRSQIGFRHSRVFAIVWRPAMYVASSVPVVLSIALPEPLSSARFKQVVHPGPRTWMHHLELRDPSEVDDEVRRWLAAAWTAAGEPVAHSTRRSPGE